MIGKLKDFLPLRDGGSLISFTTNAQFADEFDRLNGKECEITIKKYSKKRRLTANNFCWALCTDIGKAMTPPLSKEEMYRKAIKEVGVYTPYPLKEEEVEIVKERWKHNGVGWFIEVVDNSKIKGYKLIHMYYGTSTYTVDEMRTLIDYLVDQAEQMEIPIPLGKKDQERLLEQWGQE